MTHVNDIHIPVPLLALLAKDVVVGVDRHDVQDAIILPVVSVALPPRMHGHAYTTHSFSNPYCDKM